MQSLNLCFVPFDRKRCQRQRRYIDSQVLEEDHQRTASQSKDVLIHDHKEVDDCRQRGRDQKNDVSKRQRHQVTVGCCVHALRLPDNDDDHHISKETDNEDDADEEAANRLVRRTVVLRVRKSSLVRKVFRSTGAAVRYFCAGGNGGGGGGDGSGTWWLVRVEWLSCLQLMDNSFHCSKRLLIYHFRNR